MESDELLKYLKEKDRKAEKRKGLSTVIALIVMSPFIFLFGMCSVAAIQSGMEVSAERDN